MYRILLKIHTISNNFYEMYSVLNDKNEITEYGVLDLEEAKAKAKELLCKEGYCDLKIISDNDYHIIVEDGKEPEIVEPTYIINITAPGFEDQCSIVPSKIENIQKGMSVNTGIKFTKLIPSFHFTIDGQDCSQGIQDWITFKPIDAQSGILYLNGITDNHNIEITIDEDSTSNNNDDTPNSSI